MTQIRRSCNGNLKPARLCMCVGLRVCASECILENFTIFGWFSWMQASLVRKLHSIATGASWDVDCAAGNGVGSGILCPLQFTLQMCDLPLPGRECHRGKWRMGRGGGDKGESWENMSTATNTYFHSHRHRHTYRHRQSGRQCSADNGICRCWAGCSIG